MVHADVENRSSVIVQSPALPAAATVQKPTQNSNSKSVTFKNSTPSITVTSSSIADGSLQRPQIKHSPSSNKLDNLCKALEQSPTAESTCLGFLEDELARLQ